MRVKVKLTEPIWRTIGTRDTSVDIAASEATVGDVLEELARQHPGFGDEVFSGPSAGDFYYCLFLNDRVVNLIDRQKACVKEEDEIFILLPVAGGCHSDCKRPLRVGGLVLS